MYLKDRCHLRALVLILIVSLLTACTTTGKMEYITSDGEHKSACETTYSWAPSVDKFAVEYVLSYCAKKAVKQGYTIVDGTLLTNDLTIPPAPNGKVWTFEYAKKLHAANKLSDKDYGYIVAYIDLGLVKI